MRNFLMKFFLEKKMWFFFIFVYWTNFSVFLSKDFPLNCQNWILRVHRKPWKEHIFFWKNISCSYRFRKWAKKFRPPRKTFWQGCANCFRPVDGFILRSFFEKKSDTIYHSRTLSKRFSAFSQKFFSRVVRKHYLKFQSLPDIEQNVFFLLSKKIATVLPKLYSMCLQEQFERTFFLKKSLQFLLYYSDTERKTFGFLSIFLRRNCQKCFLHIHGNISTENIFYNIN